MPGKNVGDDPAGDVGGSAGSKRHDDGHRPRGIVLGPRIRNAGCGHQGEDRRSPNSSHRQPPRFCFMQHHVGFGGKPGHEEGLQAIAIISSSLPPEPAASPTALPISALATGEANEIEPAFGSASSSPTMRNVCTRPSARLNVTVLPNATTSATDGAAWTWAVRSRSEKYLMSRSGIAESRRFSLTSSVLRAAS